MSTHSLPLDAFLSTFRSHIELSSVALGGEVVAVSDEFFAEASNLIKVEAAPSLKGQFGPKGALYSGWESRRHNKANDWCIIKLGAPGFISGFDIDTSHFNGNEAPEVSVEALLHVQGPSPTKDDPRWAEILPRVHLGPSSRHLFKASEGNDAFNYVKLSMYPDGGIARFRVYGLVNAIVRESDASFDLAHVYSGGRIVVVSDQHFGVGMNLLLPGRGKDMGDGWETKRSRTEGHKDWVILKLGVPGHLESAELDTAHFMGNFPESCELHAIHSQDLIPVAKEEEWTEILPRSTLGPHRQHYFQLSNVSGSVYTHVRMTIYPDGGIKRLRITGRPAASARIEVKGGGAANSQTVVPEATRVLEQQQDGSVQGGNRTKAGIPALPLTPEAFLPFGRVIQSFSTPHAAPARTKVSSANQGSAQKFHKLALLEESYPDGMNATPGISTYRCQPLQYDAKEAAQYGWEVKLLERHPYTTQVFVPMGAASEQDSEGIVTPGTRYLVVVASNTSDEDDSPDLGSLRAFVAHAGQAIMYNKGIWHHPMIALEKPMDFACVETQIGDGSTADCEILELHVKQGDLPRVKIPLKL